MPINEKTNRDMEPLPSVFGGERQTPHAVFEKSRSENAGATANHRPNDLALACPTCRNAGETSRMFAKEGVGYYCMKGHTWKDMDALMALNPDKLAFQGQKARQEGFREVRLDMPGSTVDILQRKFGDRLAATVAAFMDVLIQGRSLIVHEEDLVRIEQNLGAQLRNGKDLVGITFERAGALRELREKAERAETRQREGRPAQAASDTSITVELGALYDPLSNLAASRDNQTLEDLIITTLQEYQKNGWI